jgi:hypothetical protein
LGQCAAKFTEGDSDAAPSGLSDFLKRKKVNVDSMPYKDPAAVIGGEVENRS